MDIQYAVNRPISAERFVELLKKTTLGERRPVENIDQLQGMLDHASLTITAWSGGDLVGIARSVTDFYYCCYLSDLAVSASFQSKGIGKELIRQTFLALKPGCKIILLSAPQAVNYYPKIGFARHESAWVIAGIEELT